MLFRFLLSSPHGDIELSQQDLQQPFLISPSEEHPFLSLNDYFGVLQEFIKLDHGKNLRAALGKQNPQASNNPADITEVVIRSEKHGAFYHIASVEICGLEKKNKFAVTTALSESARTSLQEEYGILQELFKISPDYLPEFFYMETVKWQAGSNTAEFLMALGEWFDGYHEWHASDDPESGDRKILLWDYENGCCFLPNSASYEMLRRIAFILTLYYDQDSFRQVYPWHHGAGDFVVKAESGAISVKLITARQYEPLVHFGEGEEADRLVAAIHFLLNLALKIRLDRLDGVGEPVWFDEFAVKAAVDGFFTGLAATATDKRLKIGTAADFLEIMQSFDTQEIYDMYESLLEIYADEDQDDFHLIQEELHDHAGELYAALQSFSLQK